MPTTTVPAIRAIEDATATVEVIEHPVARRLSKRLRGFNGEAHLYQMLPPFDGHRFVIASSVVAYSGFETLVFPASADGDVESWGEIAGGRGIDASDAFAEIGYEIEVAS